MSGEAEPPRRLTTASNGLIDLTCQARVGHQLRRARPLIRYYPAQSRVGLRIQERNGPEIARTGTVDGHA
jgi:hypothetical protein